MSESINSGTFLRHTKPSDRFINQEHNRWYHDVIVLHYWGETFGIGEGMRTFCDA